MPMMPEAVAQSFDSLLKTTEPEITAQVLATFIVIFGVGSQLADWCRGELPSHGEGCRRTT